MLPRLEIVRRLRPVDLVAPGAVQVSSGSAGTRPLPSPAPYVAATSGLDGPLALHLAGLRLGAAVEEASVSLTITRDHTTQEVRSRRFHRAADPTELDQCWDLLRQRDALRSAGGDTSTAAARSEDVVEKYLG